MPTLIQYPPALGLRSGSPFCVKVEALLALGGIAYDLEIWHDPRKAPKGKLPVLRDGDKLIADSAFICKHLEANHQVNFDEGLSPEQVATSMAFARLIEEHLYWSIMHIVWLEDDNWNVLKDTYFATIPGFMKPFILPSIRGGVQKQLRGHGMGLHTPEEINAFGRSNLEALDTFLGDKPFFFGEQPTGIDASLYAFLSNVLDTSLRSPLKEFARGKERLVAYNERAKKRIFGDTPAGTAKVPAKKSSPAAVLETAPA